MRVIQIGLFVGVGSALCGAMLYAQVVNPPMNTQAPKDKQIYLSAATLQKWVQDAHNGGKSSTVHPFDGPHFGLSIVHREGVEAPQIHKDEVGLYIVQAGECVAVSGGELVGPIRTNDAGDRRGTAINGGTKQTLNVGDIVFIPPGVAHMNEMTPGSKGCTYYSIHFPGNWPPSPGLYGSKAN